MSILLEAIRFNHDTKSADCDAINVRKNASHAVPTPEWQRGRSIKPEDSPAAYSIADTRGQTIVIKVQLRRTNPDLSSVEVRAIDPAWSDRGRILGWLRMSLLPAGNLLGEVAARTVKFKTGDSTGFVTFPLRGVRLDSAGVDVQTVTWRWQYRRRRNDPWTDFALSEHRIYSVLDLPNDPWQQDPASPDLFPWTDALDYGCTWARGAHDRAEAAARVTKSIYELGPSVITYDCAGGGATNYAFPDFQLTDFLGRLRGRGEPGTAGQLHGLRHDRLHLRQRHRLRPLAVGHGL